MKNVNLCPDRIDYFVIFSDLFQNISFQNIFGISTLQKSSKNVPKFIRQKFIFDEDPVFELKQYIQVGRQASAQPGTF